MPTVKNIHPQERQKKERKNNKKLPTKDPFQLTYIINSCVKFKYFPSLWTQQQLSSQLKKVNKNSSYLSLEFPEQGPRKGYS